MRRRTKKRGTKRKAVPTNLVKRPILDHTVIVGGITLSAKDDHPPEAPTKDDKARKQVILGYSRRHR